MLVYQRVDGVWMEVWMEFWMDDELGKIHHEFAGPHGF